VSCVVEALWTWPGCAPLLVQRQGAPCDTDRVSIDRFCTLTALQGFCLDSLPSLSAKHQNGAATCPGAAEVPFLDIPSSHFTLNSCAAVLCSCYCSAARTLLRQGLRHHCPCDQGFSHVLSNCPLCCSPTAPFSASGGTLRKTFQSSSKATTAGALVCLRLHPSRMPCCKKDLLPVHSCQSNGALPRQNNRTGQNQQNSYMQQDRGPQPGTHRTTQRTKSRSPAKRRPPALLAGFDCWAAQKPAPGNSSIPGCANPGAEAGPASQSVRGVCCCTAACKAPTSSCGRHCETSVNAGARKAGQAASLRPVAFARAPEGRSGPPPLQIFIPAGFPACGIDQRPE
jgi:hypothetical protein